MWVSLDSLSLDSPLNLGVLGFIGFENCLIVYGDALLAGTLYGLPRDYQQIFAYGYRCELIFGLC